MNTITFTNGTVVDSFSIGDFNHDSQDDYLVLYTDISNISRAALLLGGQFGSSVDLTNLGASGISITGGAVLSAWSPGDFNGDGASDVVINYQDASSNLKSAVLWGGASTGVFDLSSLSNPPATPVITGVTGAYYVNNIVYTNNPNVTLNGLADPNTVITLFNDYNQNGLADAGEVTGVTVTNAQGNWSYTWNNLPEGDYIAASVIATDATGNSSSTSVGLPLKIDTTAPSAPIFTGIDGAIIVNNVVYTNNPNVTITGTADAFTTITLFNDNNQDGVADASEITGVTTTDDKGIWSFTWNNLATGLYSPASAIATDFAGNNSSVFVGLPLVVNAANSVILHGTAGSDTLLGSIFDDAISGESGNDFIFGRAGNDNIEGGLGNDYIDGGNGSDTLAGGAGRDTYFVDNPNDVIIEDLDMGIDTVRAKVSYALSNNVENLILTGLDNLSGIGNSLNNKVYGNHANNQLLGLEGNDFLWGGKGADTLIGGLGKDTLFGGQGNDIFLFNTDPKATDNVDKIVDFQHGKDHIEFDTSIYTALDSATSANFASGSGASLNAAITADTHLIYDTKSGVIYYDVDGKDGEAAVKVAYINPHAGLDFNDFMFINHLAP